MTEQKTKQLKPIDEVCGSITKMEAKFKAALPPQIKPEKFIRIVLTAIQNNPELLNYDRMSLYASALKAAQDGLLPDGKESAFVPFKNKITFMPMIAGILKKVRNSGELGSLAVHVIFQNDKFRFWVDKNAEHLEFEPNLFNDRGEPIGAFAIATTKTGENYIEVMNKKEIESVKNMARSKNVWESAFWGEMWKKTVLRRLSKRLPMSTDLEGLIQSDDELYDLKQMEQPKLESKRVSRVETLLENIEDISSVQLEDDVKNEVKDVPMPEEEMRGK